MELLKCGGEQTPQDEQTSATGYDKQTKARRSYSCGKVRARRDASTLRRLAGKAQLARNHYGMQAKHETPMLGVRAGEFAVRFSAMTLPPILLRCVTEMSNLLMGEDRQSVEATTWLPHIQD